MRFRRYPKETNVHKDKNQRGEFYFQVVAVGNLLTWTGRNTQAPGCQKKERWEQGTNTKRKQGKHRKKNFSEEKKKKRLLK